MDNDTQIAPKTQPINIINDNGTDTFSLTNVAIH
jgi:hypothetical protein